MSDPHPHPAPLVGVFLSRAVPASLLAPCLPHIARDLDVGYAAVGSLVGVFYLGYTLAVLSVARLSARFGRRALLVGGTALLWASSAGIAAAPTFATAAAAAFVFGVAGVGDLTATVLLADARVGGSGRRLSWGHGAYALGAVLVPAFSGLALAAGIGFRAQFLVAAALNLLEFLWILASPLPRVDPPDRSAVPPVSWRALFPVLLLAATYVAAESGIAVWIPTFLAGRFDLASDVAALGAAVLWGTMFVGRLALSTWVDRLDRARLASVLGASAAVASAALLWAPGVPLAFAATVALGLSFSATFPALQALASTRFPGSTESVLGRIAAASGVAGAAGPWFVGSVAEAVAPPGGDPGAGLAWGLVLVPVSLAVFSALAWWVPGRRAA